MPRKMRTPKHRIDTEITEAERDWFLDEGWAALAPSPSEDRVSELWAAYGDELLAEYRQKNGLFCRPDYWWGNEAPESRRETESEDRETQKAYFLRHPELQRAEEKGWLRTHKFTRWELMPCSEMVDIEQYQRSPNWRAMLRDDEVQALNQYLQQAGALNA